MADDVDLETVRLTWAYVNAQVDLHKQFYVQLFVGSVTFSLPAALAVVLERVEDVPGLTVALVALLPAAYAQVQLHRLRRYLKRAYRSGQVQLQRLKKEGRR